MYFTVRFLTLLAIISISASALAQSTSERTADFSAAYANRYWQEQSWQNGALVAPRISPKDETEKGTFAGPPPLSKGDNPDRYDTFGYVDSSGLMKRGDAAAVYDENGRMI